MSKKAYSKDFDGWNGVLKRLERRVGVPSFSEREVWVVAWGVCSGSELDGKGLEFGRPVLIYKKLNNRKFFAIPLSGTKKRLSGWYPYDYGSLVIEEGRPLDANRLLHKKKKMSQGDFRKVCGAVVAHFEISID